VLPPGTKGLCLASYRSSWIRPSLTADTDVYVLARTTDPDELDFLRLCLGEAADYAEAILAALPGLPAGQFILVQPGLEGRPAPLSFAPQRRETAHIRHLAKYADARVSADWRFIFRGLDGREVGSAESLTDFLQALERIDPAVLDRHARRGDFSRWVRDVFSDRELARWLRKAEHRWVRGELNDLVQGLMLPIQARYDIEV
jgi:hypothetical protein